MTLEPLTAAIQTKDPVIIIIVGLFCTVFLLVVVIFAYFRKVNTQLIKAITEDNKRSAERLVDLERELRDQENEH